MRELFNKREEIYGKALQLFGLKHQMDITIEEMSELIKEISKYSRYGNNVDNLVEEIVDVEIMLEQLKQFFNMSSELIDNTKNEKLKKLVGHIEKAECKQCQNNKCTMQ